MEVRRWSRKTAGAGVAPEKARGEEVSHEDSGMRCLVNHGRGSGPCIQCSKCGLWIEHGAGKMLGPCPADAPPLHKPGMAWQPGEVCGHGALGRACPICERDEEIAALKTEVARLRRIEAAAKSYVFWGEPEEDEGGIGMVKDFRSLRSALEGRE